MRSKLASKASTTAGSVIRIRSLSWRESPELEKLPEPVRNTSPSTAYAFKCINTLALDPREDIGMRKQCFDKPPSNGSMLGELRPVEIEADDHVAFRGAGQRLDVLRVGEDISGHVDGQFGAANLLNVDALKIFSRSIMDLDPGSALGPRCDRKDQPCDGNCENEAGRHWPS